MTEILYRQVNPSWIKNGRVTSQAFRPTHKDHKKLSVYDGSMITAESAWEHYSNTLGMKSDGVLAVTRSECTTRDLSINPDPGQYDEHVLIDFSRITGSIKKTAKNLTHLARKRGWCYRPNTSVSGDAEQ